MLFPVQLPRTGRDDFRPKMLLADNHPQLLKIVARLLASDFNVVSTVSDGRQALESFIRVDPDVVILDIGMPELDGFQTLEELRRISSRAKVVMLTMHESDGYIVKAIELGAQGYVIKGKIYSDLISAIDHALDGRIFVPSLPALSDVGCDHAVQFHMNNEHFLDQAARFSSRILESGELLVVTMTQKNRLGIRERLKARGFDMASMAAHGQYIELDAEETLPNFMRNGRPDAALLANIVADLDCQRAARGPESRLTVLGDLAAVLCRDGNFDAAIELEQTWSRATRDLPFRTVCCYSNECFQNSKSRELVSKLCAEHGAVCHAFNA